MRATKWAWGVMVLAIGLVVAQAQEQPGQPKQGQPPKTDAKPTKPEQAPGGQDAEMAEMMKKFEEYGTVGQHHKYLEPLVGKWTFTMKWWMSPDAPADEGTGTSEYKLIYGGRFLQQEVTSPAHDDQPEFKGTGLIGYDNLKKQYESIWFDSMGTGMMIGRGDAEQGGKVIKVSGTSSCPMSGQTDKKWRSVMTIQGPDKHMFEMFETGPDGKEFRVAEIQYTRAK